MFYQKQAFRVDETPTLDGRSSCGRQVVLLGVGALVVALLGHRTCPAASHQAWIVRRALKSGCFA